MLRLGYEGVESQYKSVVWEEKKKEKNMFIRKKEKKIREREETQRVPEREHIRTTESSRKKEGEEGKRERRDTESSREREHIRTMESSREKREFYTLWPNASFSLPQTDKIEGLTKIVL